MSGRLPASHIGAGLGEDFGGHPAPGAAAHDDDIIHLRLTAEMGGGPREAFAIP
jgi:hypothetical protein